MTPHEVPPNYGGRVPVDTTPGPVPVYWALQLVKPRRQDLVDELQLRINHRVPDTPTGMSTTLSKYCLGPHVEASPGTSTTSRCTPTGMQQPVQTAKELQLWELGCLLHHLHV